MKKQEIEVKFELTKDEFYNFTDENNFIIEITYGYFKEDFSNIDEGIFPRIKYIENKNILVTVKRKNKTDNDYFNREETEISFEINKLNQLRELFNALGFTKEIIFEKKRKLIKEKEVEIAFDILPFGYFIEIEGLPEDIEKYVTKMNLTNKKRITKAYLALWDDYKNKHKLEEQDCIFNKQKR